MIAIACSNILKRIILLAYFLLKSPPKAKPPKPTIKTITTNKQDNITNIWAFSAIIKLSSDF